MLSGYEKVPEIAPITSCRAEDELGQEAWDGATGHSDLPATETRVDLINYFDTTDRSDSHSADPR